jgi:hypothetical protein
MRRRGDRTTTVPSQDVVAGIDKAQRDRERKLTGYMAREHYTVRNTHFSKGAELDVVFKKEKGKV